MYEKEVVDQQAVIDKLKAKGEDEYVIRKQVTGCLRSIYSPINCASHIPV